MIKKIFICISALAFFSCNKPDFTTEDTFIHVFSSAAALAKQAADEGIIVFAKEGNTPVIYRMNNEGSKIWRKDISGLFSSHSLLSVTALAPSGDGGCMLAGNFFIDTSTYYRSVLLLSKLDKNGEIIFTLNADTLYTAGTQSFQDIVQTSDGGWAALVMRTNSSFLSRFDASGHITSSTPIANAVYWKKLIQTSDKGFAALGYSGFNFGPFYQSFFLYKTDSTGDPEWTQSIYPVTLTNSPIPDTVTTIVSDFIETPSSEFLVCGHSSFLNGSSMHDFDFFITKLNASGDTLLTKTFSNPYNDFSKKIILTQDNKILISGSESTLPYEVIRGGSFSQRIENNFYRINSSSRCFVIKLNGSLQQIWSKSYGNGFGSDGVLTIERSDGSYLICGNQVSFGNKNALSLFTLKVLKTGELP